MNAWHQGRSPGRKGNFTDLFLSLSLSFFRSLVCAVCICLYLALLTLLSPFCISSSLSTFPLHTASVWSRGYSFSLCRLDSVTVFCGNWLFHFQSAGLPFQHADPANVNCLFKCRDKNNCEDSKQNLNPRNNRTLNLLKPCANTLVWSGTLSFLRQTVFFSAIV